jgi:predicted acyl esterase
MRLPTWAARTLLIAGAAALLALAAFVVIHERKPGGGSNGPDVTASIPAAGGVTLSADVLAPGGPGPYPLVVMPASWGSGASEYRNLGAAFAGAGFTVVAYSQRGFQGSGGEIDFAGRTTQDDVSTVISWALKHTHADPNRIGLFGTSYGGGVALLGAAHDKRVKAVVATSTWTDLADALVPQGAVNEQALGWLFDSPTVPLDKLTSQVHKVADDAKSQPLTSGDALEQMSATRSVDKEINALNRNKPAIMIANAYEDSLLDPTSLVSFFDKLHTAKRLQLSTGDHGGPEIGGLRGQPNAVISTAGKWLDFYLNGTKNDINKGGQILLQDGATGAVHTYTSWPATMRNLKLGTPGIAADLTTTGPGSWSHDITTGQDSGASIGTAAILSGNEYRSPTISIGSLKSEHAFTWSSVALPGAAVVSGTPRLRVQVRSSAPKVTLFAYLYDVDPSGTATLMTYAPATVSSGSVSLDLRPLAWTVAAGDHLSLVIDSADDRYASAEPAGTTLTLASPASLSIPTA